MYHTFQAATPTLGPDDVASGKSGRPGGPRRISTSNACVECRRRKIRCDGLKPCGQCQWYQHPEACVYSKPTQRVVPSRKYAFNPFRSLIHTSNHYAPTDSSTNCSHKSINIVRCSPACIRENTSKLSSIYHGKNLSTSP